MRPVFSIAFLVSSFFLFSSVLTAQRSTQNAAPEPAAQSTRAAEAPAKSQASSSLTEEDQMVLREDIARMRAILGQMESNLAFVDTTQSPLKHQFQLEIDMWNTAINDMERRLKPKSK